VKRTYQIISSVFALGTICPPIFRSCQKVKFEIKEVMQSKTGFGMFASKIVSPRNQVMNLSS
jgi:hypothetical protein